ncbi:MAG: deoxyribonuclease IV [Acidobacteriota bacterium]|nr:deoxyribonuclease IV [Acidobacteriota bacterium]
MPRAVDRAVATGCDALQIFTKSTGQWRARELPDEEVAAFRRKADAASLSPRVAHASYLVNLATAEPALRARSIAGLVEELDRAERLGLDGLVLHPGATVGGGEQDGLRLVAEASAEALKARPRQRVKLLFEHTAGQGSSLGWRFEHLHAILELLDGTPRAGVCLDTCHLLAAGYDWRTPSGYRKTFDAFERLVGFDRLAVMHLNDSKKPCGSRVDRHEHIGKGEIGTMAFKRLVNDPRFAHIGMVLETPKKADTADADPFDRENLYLLRSLVRKGKGKVG